jgi:hypothetical protein
MKILSMYYLQRACIDVTPYNNLFIFLRVWETCRRHSTTISLLSYDQQFDHTINFYLQLTWNTDERNMISIILVFHGM